MTGFAGGAAVAVAGTAMGGRSFFFSTGTGGGAGASSALGSGAGVSSTVECLPVVHGGMARNSSKVRTRGLQHFQPENLASVGEIVGRSQSRLRGRNGPLM
jgi:hypothetical protein